MQQSHEFVHESLFRTILRRPEPAFVRHPAFAPLPQQIEPVVHLQKPGPSVHPFAQLAATAHLPVHKRAVDVNDRPLIAELDSGRPADDLLPQGPGPRRRGIDLELKRALEADPINQIAKKAGEARRRDQDLHGIAAARLQPGDWDSFDPEHFHPVDLPRKAASHKSLDRQMNVRRPVTREALNLVGQLGPRFVAADAHRPAYTGAAKSLLKLSADLDTVVIHPATP